MQPSWVETAACRNAPVETFFPDEQHPTPDMWVAAKNICAGCPHRKPCLLLALNFETPDVHRFGVWGGLSPQERERLMEGTGVTPGLLRGR